MPLPTIDATSMISFSFRVDPYYTMFFKDILLLTTNCAYAPSHLTLANNQRLSQNLGKAPSIIAGASGYPNAPTRTCFGNFQVGFS